MARLLRLPDVMEKVGLKRSHLYKLRSEGKFPEGFLLSPRVRVWDEEELEKWMKERENEN